MTNPDAATIPLGEAKVGARLAAPVLGADGQVLLAAGSILTEATLERLARRGVANVAVEALRDEAELAAAREALGERLAYVFRRCDLDGDGCAQMLYQAVLAYRLENLR